MTDTPAPTAQQWKLRYAPHTGYPSRDKPMFLESAGSADPVDQIRWLAEQGFAGIDDHYIQQRPVRDQERIGEELARHGMSMGCFVGTIETMRLPVIGKDSPEAREQLKRELLAAIETARRCGRHLTTIGQRSSRVPLGFQLAAMVENLKRLAEIAEKAGVVMCLEQTAESRTPNMLLHRLADAYRVVQAVGSPSVRLLFDILPVQIMEGNIIENLTRTWDAIEVIQAGDNPGRLEPGSGELNFSNIFRFIHERGYRGMIGLEHTASRPGIEGERLIIERLRAIDASI